MQKSTKDILERFIERAKLLQTSSFLVAAKSTSANLMPSEGTAPVFEGPNREQYDSFILNLRFFIQDNEPISLRKVSELLEKDLSIRTGLRQDFEDIRTHLNTALQTLPPIKVTSNDIPVSPTWRDIYEVFIYGEYAHNTKREIFETWRKHAPTFVLFNYYFVSILIVMASGVVFCAKLFEQELHGQITAP